MGTDALPTAWDPDAEVVRPESVLRFIPASVQRLFDCGAGSGTLPELLKQRGDIWIAGAGGGEFVDQVVAPPEDVEPPLEAGSVDCVLAVDWFPRLREPEAALARVARLLTPGGVLVATVPNLQYYRIVLMLARGEWKLSERGILARDHLRFFTGVEAVQLLRGAGLEVRAMTGLVKAAPESVPRDKDGFIHDGDISVGPLNDADYSMYLTSQYLVLATKPA